jgi:acyl-coenzyme A synthetase/AMP-(fatty) acid ligase/acyl carrier protein
MSGCPAVRAFETIVDAGPRRPAVVLRDRVVSFAELDGRANAVAHLLHELPGGRRDPVVLSISDPVAMVAAQFGTLKAGRPFVVINPHFPAGRRQAMRQLLRANTVLCDPGAATAEAVAVPEEPSPSRPACDAGPDDLAYVLFTSGSTGVPKGIAQIRADMVHNVRRHAPLHMSPADRITLISADGVISAVSNMIVGVLNGAAVAPYSYRDDGVDGMVGWLAGSGVTVFYAFPSFLRQLAKVTSSGSVPAIRLAYLGGEPVFATDFTALGRLFPAAVRATGLNSTETGLTRLFQLPAGAPVPTRIPLGGPVDGVDVTIADDDRIVIRSPFVKPRLWTEDGLVDLTTSGPDGIPEFVTGDRGELGVDGTLVHLGRGDTMVKIRGFRVEPSEVEDAIAKVDGVAEVGVLAHPGDDGELELAAVVTVHRPEVNPTVIRLRASELLPQPLVPTTVLVRDSLPHIANGKLDRRALTAIVTAARQVESSRPARAAPEPAAGTYERLRTIWQAVLRTERISADDDFFTLGGTSISALGVISRVRKEFGVPVRLAVLFETPTLAALTQAVYDLNRTGR